VDDEEEPTFDISRWIDVEAMKEDEREYAQRKMGANIQKSLKSLGKKSLANLQSFVDFAQKEGYIGKTPTVTDVQQLVSTWKAEKK
jgi:hypothetical protein